MRDSIRNTFSGDRPSRNGSRLCIFASFDPKGEVAPYVELYLKSLSEIGFDIVFVQSSDRLVSSESYQRIRPYCRQIINRQNVGYDFGSWKVGLKSIPDLYDYDKLLITNDSVVGPFTSLRPALDQMDSDPSALWAMTDCFDLDTHHLQSYFIYCDIEVFSKPFFKRFWRSVGALQYKWQIVLEHEVGLSKAATSAGVPLKAAFPYSEVKKRCIAKGGDFQFSRKIQEAALNSTLHAWDILIQEMSFPFIKAELLRSNRLDLQWLHRWPSVVAHAPREIVQAALDFEDTRRWAIPERHSSALPEVGFLGRVRRTNPALYALLDRRYDQARRFVRDVRNGDMDEVTRKLGKLRRFGKYLERFARNRKTSSRDISRETYFAEAKQEFAEFLAGDVQIDVTGQGDPRVTVILILFNKAELTYRCLRSLEVLRDEPSFHVLIIDNASSDSTTSLLERVKGATIIRNKDNLGFLKACNQAAELVTSEHILFFNNDTILYPGSIQAAVEDLGDPSVGAVGGRIVLPNESLQEAGSIFWNDGTCAGFGRGFEKEADECMHRRDVDYCSGVFLMTPTKLFREIGGFDELFAPAYYEEADYCAQLQSRGFRIVYDPRIVVTHVEFGSSERSQAAFDLMNANRGKFVEKNRALLATKHAPQTPHYLAHTLRSGKPRVLFLDDRVALQHIGAGYPRMNRVINALYELGEYDITVSCTERFFGDWEEIRSGIPLGIEVLDLTPPSRRESFLQERLAEFDVVWVSRPSNMEHLVKAVPQEVLSQRRYTLIYDSEAIFADRALTEARTFGLPEDLAQSAMEQELRRGALADIIVSVCESDAKRWRASSGKNVIVLGFDAPVVPGLKNFAARKDILFAGSLHDILSPNTDSLFWFMGQVIPHIRKSLPEVTVRAVGFVDKNLRQQIGSNSRNFELIGSVPDLRPYFLEHRIVVVPTRFAAGIPQKVFDAAVTGTPTVCSPLIAAQMEWHDGVETLVGSVEDPEDFARKCLALYSDEALWGGIYERSLESMRQYSNGHTIEKGLGEVLAEVTRLRGCRSSVERNAVVRVGNL